MEEVSGVEETGFVDAMRETECRHRRDSRSHVPQSHRIHREAGIDGAAGSRRMPDHGLGLGLCRGRGHDRKG
jgi:hypothetical protein